MSKDQGGRYVQRLHALDLRNGSEEFGGPVEIRATFPGSAAANRDGTEIFDPKQYEERAALLLLNGVVYASWASHCDINPYNGWVIGYSAETLKLTAVLNLTPNGEEGAVWQSGAGPAADDQGNIYLDGREWNLRYHAERRRISVTGQLWKLISEDFACWRQALGCRLLHNV